MGKNERIIAQDLTEIKGTFQQYTDPEKLREPCIVLAKEIKKYPVNPEISPRIEKISLLSESSSFSTSLVEDTIKEIDELVEILISS